MALARAGARVIIADITATVVWLSSDAAAFVTGHILAVDGGLMAQEVGR